MVIDGDRNGRWMIGRPGWMVFVHVSLPGQLPVASRTEVGVCDGSPCGHRLRTIRRLAPAHERFWPALTADRAAPLSLSARRDGAPHVGARRVTKGHLLHTRL